MAISTLLTLCLAQLIGGDWILRHEIWSSRSMYSYPTGAICDAGDWDLDGRPDYAVGYADELPQGGPYVNGVIRIHSGVDGAVLDEIVATLPDQKLGARLALLGDVNADGRPDLFAASISTTHASISVFEGGTGLELVRILPPNAGLDFGVAAVDLGDVDNDGHDDFAIGHSGYYFSGLTSGAVYLYSGRTFALLWSYVPTVYGHAGSSLAAVGDVDNDGVRDLAVGAPWTSPVGSLLAGALHFVSGADGSAIATLAGDLRCLGLGASLANAGDLDGDGFDELFVGCDRHPYVWQAGESGELRAYSAKTRALLWTVRGPPRPDDYGISVARLDDLDGDRVPEALVGAPAGLYPILAPGHAEIRSGADGAMLREFRPAAASVRFGQDVAGIGDVDGDGLREWLIVDPERIPAPASLGIVECHAFQPHLTAEQSEASVSLGATLVHRLDFGPGKAGDEYRLLLARQAGLTVFGVEVPLRYDSLFLRSYLGYTPPIGTWSGTTGTLDPLGRARAEVVLAPAEIPANAVGARLWFAAVSLRPGGAIPTASSIAVSVLVVP